MKLEVYIWLLIVTIMSFEPLQHVSLALLGTCLASGMGGEKLGFGWMKRKSLPQF
jgi:hypothetical protein